MTPIDVVRAVVTILWFALFVAISIGAWRRWPRDSVIARLPLENTERVPGPPEERV